MYCIWYCIHTPLVVAHRVCESCPAALLSAGNKIKRLRQRTRSTSIVIMRQLFRAAACARSAVCCCGSSMSRLDIEGVPSCAFNLVWPVYTRHVSPLSLRRRRLAIFILISIFYFVAGAHKVHCSEDQMRVEIGLPSETSNSTSDLDRPQIYLEGLKGYPDVRCQPEINGALAVFRLSLSDFYECGVTRMVNQLTVGGADS